MSKNVGKTTSIKNHSFPWENDILSFLVFYVLKSAQMDSQKSPSMEKSKFLLKSKRTIKNKCLFHHFWGDVGLKNSPKFRDSKT